MLECWVFQKKERKIFTTNPVATINKTTSSTKNSDSVQHSYHPFISSGFLSDQESDSPIPIKILSDTDASQSLLVEGVLPLSDQSATGDYVVIKGVELGFTSCRYTSFTEVRFNIWVCNCGNTPRPSSERY